jgi:predicted glycogen debranching enzyme
MAESKDTRRPAEDGARPSAGATLPAALWSKLKPGLHTALQSSLRRSPAQQPLALDETAEWLEADGLGGFASGTAALVRTRRYHALLLAATTTSTGRVVLVNGMDAWIDTRAGRFAISAQRYAPDVVYPDGQSRLREFTIDPWPRWIFELEDGLCVQQELFVPRELPAVALCWKTLNANRPASLLVRPLLSGRDYHALHHENPAFCFESQGDGTRVTWHPYEGVPGVAAISNGRYAHEPQWYRNFQYQQERERGLDDTEDLASPGTFTFDLVQGDAVLMFAVAGQEAALAPSRQPPLAGYQSLRAAEAQRREEFPSPLERAADTFLVQSGARRTIIAGYPWFTDWGRDTFIALRGLCLATGRLAEARDILLAWAGAVSEGMLPNRFPDGGEAPEFNSVDASLWYIIAVDEYLRTSAAAGRGISPGDGETLRAAIAEILSGYARGTRYRIHADDDGLLASGEPGVQLTWMDAKVGDWVVTPRIGKPVEVQALWLGALAIGAGVDSQWQPILARGREAFRARFWNPDRRCLYDVVDCDHQSGAVDAALRPNQILAVGGLPLVLLDDEQARAVVDAVEAELWTPLGLRSLEPGAAGYRSRYEGGVRDRDGAYHQGTVWPWLAGPFVEAWLRVRGSTHQAKREARQRFLPPLVRHLAAAGLGHVSEIADGDAPHAPRGCPFQAWSLGELLRLNYVVLAE